MKMYSSTCIHNILLLCIVILCKFKYSSVDACYISGTDSGICSYYGTTNSPLWRQQNMPFCAGYVTYPACMPAGINSALPPTRRFPEGRFTNNTVIAKDTWVGESAQAHVNLMISYEQNSEFRKRGYDVNGHIGKIYKRFYKRPDCKNAFFALFCWTNFPRCDLVKNESLPVCKSSCENFYKNCRYKKDLFRCGKSKWFNGYEPEVPQGTNSDGSPIYLR